MHGALSLPKVLDKSSKEVWGLTQAGVSAKLLPELLWDSFCFLQDKRNMRWEQAKTLWQITGAMSTAPTFHPYPHGLLDSPEVCSRKICEFRSRQTQMMAPGDSQNSWVPCKSHPKVFFKPCVHKLVVTITSLVVFTSFHALCALRARIPAWSISEGT